MAVFPGSQSLGKISSNTALVSQWMWSLWLTMYGQIYFWAALWPGVIFQPATLNVKAYIEFFRELINYKGKECYLIPLCQSDPPKVRVSILTFDPMCLLSREHEVLKICVFWFETHTKKILWMMAITLTERDSLSHSARVVRQTAMACLSSANNLDAFLRALLRIAVWSISYPVVSKCQASNQSPRPGWFADNVPTLYDSSFIREFCKSFSKLLAAELCCRWISYPEICRSPLLRKKSFFFCISWCIETPRDSKISFWRV